MQTGVDSMIRSLINKWLRGADTAEKLETSMAGLFLGCMVLASMMHGSRVDTFVLGGFIFLAAASLMAHARCLQGENGKGSL